MGYTTTEGAIITGQGSVSDVTIKNDADVTVMKVLTGTTTMDFAGDITTAGNIDGRDVATDGTKLDTIETSADVTDEANVTDALDGATLTDLGTPASGDLILLQDASDSNNLKVAQFSEFGGGGGGQETYDIIVAPSGGDYTTLGAALAAASAGDRILVKNGTYTESSLSTSLAGLTIIGQSKGSTDIQILANNWTFSGANVSISNLKITYTTGDWNLTGANAYMSNCHHYANTTSSTGYIYVTGVRATITGCIIESQSSSTSSTAYLLYLNGEHGTVSDCKFNTQVRSLAVIKVTKPWCIISSNTFYYYGTGSATTDIIDVNTGFNSITIADNSFDLRDATNEPHAITCAAYYSTITGNLISGGGDKTLQASNGSVVSGNVLKYFSGTGVYITGPNAVVTGNFISAISTSSTTGILTTSSADNSLFSGNTLDTLNIGVSVVSGADNCSVGLNNFSNTTTDISDAASGTGYLIGAVVDDTTPQLGGDLDLNQKYVQLDPTPTSDHTGNGEMASVTVDVNATGIGALLYVASDGNYEEADADAATTAPAQALALESGTGTKKVLLRGYFRDDTWTWTVGGLLYLSTTSGAMTQTAPSGTGDQVQVVGYAVSADAIYFNPSLVLVEVA